MKKLLGYPKMLEEAKLGKPGHSWFIELVIFLVVLFIGQKAESIPISFASVIWLCTDSSLYKTHRSDQLYQYIAEILASMPEWLMIFSLFATAFMTWVVFVYCRKIERRSTASMGFRKHGFFKEYVTGSILGILMITASLGIAMLTGAVTVTPKDLTAPAAVLLLLWLVGYFIQGMSEEVMVRGYLMVSMTRTSSVWVSVILSSAVFALLHISNPGIGPLPLLNLFLCGLVFGIYTVKRGNIWGACAMHTFWNFYQGCIYGVSVSGTGSVNSALFHCVNAENMELWNGGTFGLEGGLAVTAVEAAMLLIVLFLVPKAKGEQAVSESAPQTEPEIKEEPAEDELKKEPPADTGSSSLF